MTVTIKSQTRIKGNVRVNFPPTPSVYLDFTRGYANGLNPLPSTVTFTRADSAAVATQVGPNGLVRLAAHNRLTYSQAINSTNWPATYQVTATDSQPGAPDGTATATLIDDGLSSGNHQVQRNSITLVAGTTYVVSAYVKDISRRYFNFSFYVDNVNYVGAIFDLTNQTTTTGQSGSGFAVIAASLIPAGSSWFRCSMAFTSGQNATNICLATANTSTVGAYGLTSYTGSNKQLLVWGAQLEQNLTPSYYVPTTTAAVYANTPRFDYDPVTLQPKGLLIEEQRVNILTYSQEFDNGAWTKSGLVTTGTPPWVNVATAPDGTVTADKLIEDTTPTTAHYVTRSGISVTNGIAYTLTVYAKAAGRNFVVVQLGSAYAWFNLATGITGTTVPASTGVFDITDAGNGWYRCRVTWTTTSTTTFTTIYTTNADNVFNYTGDGVSGIFVWGAQLEHAGTTGTPASAPFSTSYIPTTTASVTRALEKAQLTGAALTVCQGSAVTLVSEAQQYSGAPTPRLISARKASGGNYTDYYTMSGLVSTMRVGNSDQAVLTYSPAPTLTSICKTAFAFQANDFAAVANNGTVQTDGTGSIVSGIDEAYIGYYTDGVYMNGWMRVAYLYNVRLSNDQIKAMTVVSPPTLTVKGATTISGSTTVR